MFGFSGNIQEALNPDISFPTIVAFPHACPIKDPTCNLVIVLSLFLNIQALAS